ncbi:hypothetical protein N7492_009607 [Penicillium capsulatum]|uniref:Uncharacterized protein n=1 Tax=Penicillium capsulatum TaxID=69766 RepID=A0A9W9HUU7_9EURO|nr:hypothetical protein N7492_009607 [Penicillium capsulatum]KAJ6106995.1 hypothetical protein N7512_010512 [Penicillium capsulatum]
MPFRERVKRVFHRSSNSADHGRPKVEYYRRHEVPPSKFRGPVDKNHQKQLAAWSFDRAMVERRRSFDLALSPCATYDSPSPSDSDDSADIAPDDDGVEINPALTDSLESLDLRPTNPGSQSSTVVNPESFSGSIMTLLPEPTIYGIPEDPIAQFKESVRYTSPLVLGFSPGTPRAMSPRGKHLPFSPDDLTRALIAVQVCA